jgi:hypothetical protein
MGSWTGAEGREWVDGAADGVLRDEEREVVEAEDEVFEK